ncbi:MAG: type IX secretion system membrane protein PorP/SprF [Bacteroidota bacterium]
MKNYIYFFALMLLGIGQADLIAQNPQGEAAWASSFQLAVDNPTAAGIDGQYHAYMGYYQRWFNLADAPSTFYAGGSIPLPGRQIGLGAFILSDQAGLLNHTRFSFFAAAHTAPKKKHRLSLGATGIWQSISLGQANVVDALVGDQATGSKINLGLGINYRLQLNSDNSWFNLMLQYPQLPMALILNEGGDEALFNYDLTGQYIIQANLQTELGGGIGFSPAVRVHMIPGKASQSIPFLDASVGFGFRDNAIHARLGIQTAQANSAYLSVGFFLNEKLRADVMLAPSEALGVSGAAHIELTTGAVKDPVIIQWLSEDFWSDQLANMGLKGFFDVSARPLKNEVIVDFKFNESNNTVYDLAADKYLRLNEFIKGLEQSLAIVEDQKGSIEQVIFYADVKKDLNEDVNGGYQGNQVLDIPAFSKEGTFTPKKSISKGEAITQGELAAVKLSQLKALFVKEVTAIPQVKLNLAEIQVEQNPNQDLDRELVIKLRIRK